MKKAICIIVILVIVLITMFCGCGAKEGEDFTCSGRFVIVSGENSNAPYFETIMADKNTGVLYLVINKGHHCGLTPLLDTDGKPLLLKDGNE